MNDYNVWIFYEYMKRYYQARLLDNEINTVVCVSFHQSNKSIWEIKVITNLPNSEKSYKGKVKTHNYINRQNQSTTGKR
jgi:hypothetical protein